MLVQVQPPPDPLLSGPICALRLMGAQCTWAVPAADQPQPDGRGGGCCPAAEAALSNCRPLRRTGTPAMRSWALQQPQPPQGGRLGGELASNARFPGLERGSGWTGAAGARDEGPGVSEPPAHASASSSVSRPAVPRRPVGLGKETSVTEAPDHSLVPVTSSFPWFHPSLNVSPGAEADPGPTHTGHPDCPPARSAAEPARPPGCSQTQLSNGTTDCCHDSETFCPTQ